MKQFPSFWARNPKAADRLKKLWLDGYSATYILDDIGGTGQISRNAVIGKAHRMGLPQHDGAHNSAHNRSNGKYTKRQYADSNIKVPKKRPRPHINVTARPRPVIEVDNMPEFLCDMPEETSANPVSLYDAEPHHCRWPVGDAKQFMFCGARIVPDGKMSFCLAHYQRAVSRTPQRDAGFYSFSRAR